LKETFKEFMELISQPTIPTSQETSLENALEMFRQTVNQPFQEIIDITVANTEAIARLEGQLGHLVVEFNIIEEEEFQSHEMWREQDMIDKHAQATTFKSEEVAKETVNVPSLEYSTLKVQTEKGETTEISFPNSSSLAVEPFI
jgi:quinol monooxygenase YgiN